MSLQTIALLVGLGAIAVAARATSSHVSPWRVFGLASAAGVLVLLLASWRNGEPCGGGVGVADWLFFIAGAISLTLYLGAVLRALVDGIRLGRARDRGAALWRAAVVTFASVLAGAIVLYAFVASAFRCWG